MKVLNKMICYFVMSVLITPKDTRSLSLCNNTIDFFFLKKKRHPDRKEEIKWSLFIDNMTVYIKYLRKYIYKTKTKFMVVKYKVNIQKLKVFLFLRYQFSQIGSIKITHLG